MLEVFDDKRVLMLQGPAGPFFWRVAKMLRGRGAKITKVNFNAGDDLFYPGPDVVRFRGTREEWPEFFADVVRGHRIERVLLFGDCRPLHRRAIENSEELGVEVYVFEEGYLRPDFVTLERGGVNGFSSIPRDPEFYRSLTPTKLPDPVPVGNVLPRAAAYASAYALSHSFGRRLYPHYQHHRDIHPLRQARLWLGAGIRRAAHTWRDRKLDAQIASGDFPPFFIVPLQVHLDAQMQHCPFDSVEDFLAAVVRSFAAHALPDNVLLVKDHPLGRPYRDYSACLDRLRSEFELGDRLRYVDVIHLPTALKAARGTVVINSTVGLSSIHHGTPVKCLGAAVYDIAGLAFHGPLDHFWSSARHVDRHLYRRYRWWLRRVSQLEGSVWTQLRDTAPNPAPQELPSA